MQIDFQNIDKLPLEDKEKRLLLSLLMDLEESRELLPESNNNLWIDWQDYHNSYSPERTDPCPDYYGYYRLYLNKQNIGIEMTVEELDQNLCTLIDFITILFKK